MSKDDYDKNFLAEIAVKAYEEYSNVGEVRTTRCPKCKSLIIIKPVSDTVLSMNCSCGLFKDTLKGL